MGTRRARRHGGATDHSTQPCRPDESTRSKILTAPGVVFRFDAAVDGKQLLAKSLKAVDEKTFQGNTYYRSTREKLAGAALAGYVADDRTILWAPEPTLHKMLAAGAARGPLVERLRDLDPDDEATGVFVLGPYGEMLGDFIQSNRDRIPPALAALTTLPDHLRAVTVTVNLAGNGTLKVVLEAGSEESADVLEDLAREGLDQARQMYPGLRQTLAPLGLDQVVSAFVEHLDGNLRADKIGTRVEVVVPRLTSAAGK